MSLDQDFFQVSKFSKDQKKGLHRNGTLFSPNSSTDLRSDAQFAHTSQIIGGDADEDRTQIVGGYTVKLLGGFISRRWLLFSWDQQRTRRKVDQFGAITFLFSFFFFLRSTENLELCRAWSFIFILVFGD